ncbi:MAG TPA: tRNA lysidine(34) synthetase TilS [Tissierellaceae bacterium]|nr:tRNA lysidine(34) synthetase TilS [Tissierellaceae bacterium]
MQDKILNNILENNLICNQDNIVLGVSGGPDSMALLYALLDIRRNIDFNIIVAHVNHGVRGDEALRDQAFVEQKANELGLKYYTRDVDMIAYGKNHKISAEEAGRKLRYEFFRDILRAHNGGKIALAHNMNDQAETLLMRIIRGTGIDGLKGMDFANDDIIRPLLNISRQEIEEYIEDNKIETVLDKTNLMPIYTRNKVRLELIPYLEDKFNPNLIKTLWRLSQTAKNDSDFLESYTVDRYLDSLIYGDNDRIVLSLNKFRQLDKSIQNRLVIYVIREIVKVFQGFSEEHISSVVSLFNLGLTGKTVELPKNLVARVDYEYLIIEKRFKNAIKSFVYELRIGYNQFDDFEFALDIKIMNIDDIEKKDKLPNIKYFDYDRIKGTLYIRNRRDGDRFIPLGMRGSKKLKDFFIDSKISRQERDKTPLILDEDNIIWVVDYRISELYKMTKNTRRVLSIEYISLPKEEK